MSDLSPETIREIERLYAQLKSFKKVAKRLNIDKESVRHHVERKAALDKKEDSKRNGSGRKTAAAKKKTLPNQKQPDDPGGKAADAIIATTTTAIAATATNPSTAATAAAAYKLYSELKRPLQVAIELGIGADEAIKYQEEYWKLSGALYLNHIQAIYPDVWNYLELYGKMKLLRLDPDQFIGYLHDLKSLAECERALGKVRQELAGMEAAKEQLEKELEGRREEMVRQDDELARKKAELAYLVNEVKDLDARKQRMISLLHRLVNSKTTTEIRDLVQE